MNLVSKTFLVGSLTSMLALTGCSSSPNSNIGGLSNDQAKVIAGTVLGGVIGHQMGKGRGKTAATVVGALIGGYLGGAMSNQSRQRTNYALDRAPDNQKTTWTEPQSNNQYAITPTSTRRVQVNGQQSTCRDYTMDAYIDGRLQQVTGRACRDNNGQWVTTG